MAAIQQIIRPLNEKERRLLNAALAWRKRRLEVLRCGVVFFSLIFFIIFAGAIIVATTLDKKGPAWYYCCLFAAVITFPISLWSYLDLKAEFIADVRLVENALLRNEACVIRIQATAMVEFEEEEDEGACYAFQLDEGQMIFISGQDFYPSAKFPNSDFSIVNIYADDEQLVESLMEKHGHKLEAVRKISSRTKSGMNIPDNLEIVEGELIQIE